jgi:hypothetical protein
MFAIGTKSHLEREDIFERSFYPKLLLHSYIRTQSLIGFGRTRFGRHFAPAGITSAASAL